MAVITCDRCEKPIDVPNAIMGQRVTCPNCGDVNVVRSLSNSPAPSTDRAAAAGYPPALGPEQDVLIVRPAMFRARPLRFLLLAGAVLAGAGGAIYFVASQNRQNALAILCAALAAVALLWLIFWKIHTLGEGLRITTKRTIDRHGLFSKETSDVLHVDIKNIQIKQSFIDRLWGVGSIALSSSAEHEDEIEISDVPHPEKVREVIDLYRQL